MTRILSSAIAGVLLVGTAGQTALGSQLKDVHAAATTSVVLSDETLDALTAGREIMVGIWLVNWDPCGPSFEICSVIPGGEITEEPPGSGEFFVHRETHILINQATPDIAPDLDVDVSVRKPRVEFDLMLDVE